MSVFDTCESMCHNEHNVNSGIRKISGGVSDVVIKDNLVIKKYTFINDSVDDSTDVAYLTTELCILNLLDGINGFPKIIEIIQDSPKYGIVMPYLGEPVTQCQNSLDVFIKILEKVAILHAHNIVHCDLKPANVVIDNNGNVSIIDFSHSYIMGNFNSQISNKNRHTRMNIHVPSTHVPSTHVPYTIYDRETISTYAYTAPETYHIEYAKNASMDVWSLGCILYELVMGQCLFDDIKRESKPCNECLGYLDYIKNKHRELDEILDKIDQIEEHVLEKKIMKLIFIRDPNDRPSVTQLLNLLGIKSAIPLKYDVNTQVGDYYPSKMRLRCYNFPHYARLLVDNLIDHISIQMKKKYRYELYYIVHMIIASLFVNKCGYEPFDTLCLGADYMRFLSFVVTEFDLSVMYQSSICE